VAAVVVPVAALDHATRDDLPQSEPGPEPG
jgi:hypothetical protein